MLNEHQLKIAVISRAGDFSFVPSLAGVLRFEGPEAKMACVCIRDLKGSARDQLGG